MSSDNKLLCLSGAPCLLESLPALDMGSLRWIWAALGGHGQLGEDMGSWGQTRATRGGHGQPGVDTGSFGRVDTGSLGQRRVALGRHGQLLGLLKVSIHKGQENQGPAFREAHVNAAMCH